MAKRIESKLASFSSSPSSNASAIVFAFSRTPPASGLLCFYLSAAAAAAAAAAAVAATFSRMKGARYRGEGKGGEKGRKSQNRA